eukprot:jgi/Bigna1/61185/fgenesh1_kg.19_\
MWHRGFSTLVISPSFLAVSMCVFSDDSCALLPSVGVGRHGSEDECDIATAMLNIMMAMAATGRPSRQILQVRSIPEKRGNGVKLRGVLKNTAPFVVIRNQIQYVISPSLHSTWRT